MTMRIGFDAKRIVRNSTGLGSYGRTLINSLSAIDREDELYLYAPDRGNAVLRNQILMRPNVSFHYPTFAPTRLRRDIWRRRKIVGDLVNDHLSLYHGLSGELPIGIHRAGIPAIVTIHDLIFLRHPEFYNIIDARIYRRKFYETIREADHIIAISECTKRDIQYYGDVPDDKITVIYQGVSPKFDGLTALPMPESIHGVNHYILQVGTIEERKNALETVKALHYLPRKIHLVLVGTPTDYTYRIRRYAEDNGLTGRIHILSGINNDELARLYQHAECFVYPSRYEGFGIPIIEAIRSGLPVVAATGSCLEEAGGPDCIYVSPDNPRALAEGIDYLISSPYREQIVNREQQYVQRFENTDVASQVLDLYNKVVYDTPSFANFIQNDSKTNHY